MRSTMAPLTVSRSLSLFLPGRKPNNGSVLIMGAPCSPDFLSQFELVIDFAEAFDADLLEQSRARFRLYRELGLNPQML